MSGVVGADRWERLATAVRSCARCPELVASRAQVVPGVRPPGAEVLLVGEAPGAREDAAGVPFVGRSGQVLDALLAEAGLRRDRVAVVNVVKCRPPLNRKPRRGEVANCRPWLAAQIDAVDPLVIVTLGATAAEWFFGPGVRLAALRERPTAYGGRPVVVTYHPAAAIRFGPNGAPLAALRADLARASVLAARLAAARGSVPAQGSVSADGSVPTG